ncbi:PAQR family membrane homeostasis protein TrhA [Azospirillum halopraeferens]|uniref:PAQR family membrane homeostasis protein TrhA n=1 Tax=Azospirillum halopraeferens TaxID=34010 RepID=UPI000413D93A|nr:hemolysin III family protein [Azospirillum halopraeferens]
MTSAPFDFPDYTDRERTADAVVHVVGVPGAIIAAAWLMSAAAVHATPLEMTALAIYCAGMVGVLTSSALYNMTPAGWWKERFRRADHAMIYIAIAGCYTPLSLTRLNGEGEGLVLCMAVWGMALAGAALKLLFPRRFERTGLVLYLLMGWAALAVVGPLQASLSAAAFALILAEGVAFTLGAWIHHQVWIPYYNPIWHVFVLIGAGCHYAAMVLEFTGAAPA